MRSYIDPLLQYIPSINNIADHKNKIQIIVLELHELIKLLDINYYPSPQRFA